MMKYMAAPYSSGFSAEGWMW